MWGEEKDADTKSASYRLESDFPEILEKFALENAYSTDEIVL